MANMRYFNLKALNNVRVSNLDPNVNVRRVFDPMHTDLANWGLVTEANSTFPQHNLGAGESGMGFLHNFMDLGSVADAVRSDGNVYDFGKIA